MRSGTTLLLVVLAALLASASPARAATAGATACHPSDARPTPVILLHGTYTGPSEIWGNLAPPLLADGYCVFALDYGDRGTARLADAADEVAAYTRRVLKRTGAARVSFVGHAQGGMLARYVARFRGLRRQIDDIVALAPPSHGTTTPLTPPAEGIVCHGCDDQLAGSDAMALLAAGDEAPAPISYTVLITTHDDVVTPFASQAIAGSGLVRNVVLQDRCPEDGAGHDTILSDPAALAWVRSALGRRGPADPNLKPACPAPDAQASAPKQSAPGQPSVLGSQSFRPHVLLGVKLIVAGGRVRFNVGCEGAAFLSCVTELRLRAGTKTIAAGRVVVRAGRATAVDLELRTPLPIGVKVRLVLSGTTQNGAPVLLSRAYRVRPRA